MRFNGLHRFRFVKTIFLEFKWPFLNFFSFDDYASILPLVRDSQGPSIL